MKINIIYDGIFRRFLKFLTFKLTSDKCLSSNMEIQLFLPILSMKWSARSERKSSNPSRNSLGEGNKMVGSSLPTVSLYARYKIL